MRVMKLLFSETPSPFMSVLQKEMHVNSFLQSVITNTKGNQDNSLLKMSPNVTLYCIFGKIAALFRV